jgi:hypothetical protein
MAKLQEAVLVLKLSKLIRDSESDGPPLTNDDFVTSLETIVQELVGDKTLVEVQQVE